MKALAFILAACIALSYNCLSVRAEISDYYNEIKIIAGDIEVISANSPTRVSIRDPKIADVVKVEAKEILITGKSKGTTDFTFWDKFGEHTYKIKVLPEDIVYLENQVRDLLKKLGFKKVYTKPIEEEGKILLLGTIRSFEDKERLKIGLGQLASKITDITQIEEEDLVEIAVEVLELDEGASQTLGFTWPTQIALSEPSAGITGLSGSFRDIFRIENFDRGAFSVTLDFLVGEGKARILSRPRIVCQSGKEAELLIGGEVPVFTTQVSDGGGEGTDVEYKEHGIKLKINPVVKQNGKIQLALAVEISELGTADVIGSEGAPTAKAYPLNQRNISTELYLNDGETLTIGGLIKQKTEEDLQRLPWLADIPILGAFFRHKSVIKGGGSSAKGDTELFITITPRIIKSSVPKKTAAVYFKEIVEEKLSKKYDYLPDQMKAYIYNVKTRVLQSVSYPFDALSAGFGGVVKLSLNISNIGELLSVNVKETSEYKIIDDSARSTVKALGPFGPFPPEIDLEDIWIDIPIVYKPN